MLIESEGAETGTTLSPQLVSNYKTMSYKKGDGEPEKGAAQPKILIIANKNTVTDPDW